MAFAVAFAAGTNDEMMVPGVAARVFSLRTSVILEAIFSVIGSIFGEKVAKTIRKGLILDGYILRMTDIMVIAVLISMVI